MGAALLATVSVGEALDDDARDGEDVEESVSRRRCERREDRS